MIERDVNYADEYADMVTNNPRDFPKTIKAAVRRYEKWKKRTDIFYDIDKANEAMDWMESFIRHVKGDLAGQLLVLEPWQKFGYAQLYGWQKLNVHGKPVRVIREVYWQVPKKNGKTLLAIGGLAFALYGEGEKGADCYCCASNFEQAQAAASPFAQTILNSPVLYDRSQIFKGQKGNIAGVNYDYTIEGISYQNKFIVMSKNIKQIEGSNPYFVLNDELHIQENMDQYDNFKSAMINRAQPIMFNISTAGKGSSSVGMRIYNESKETLKNDDDDSKLVLIYEPDKGYDWEDRKVWRMVNPNIDVGISMEALENAFLTAVKSAHSKSEFLSKHLNVFVSGAENFFDKDQLEGVLVNEIKDVDGLECVIGLDLSKTTDLTCVSLNFITYNDDGKSMLKVKQRYFIPDSDIEYREQQDNVPYRDLAAKGHVEFCDGKMINQEQVKEFIIECIGKYDVKQINYDPAMSERLITDIENIGIDCFEVKQRASVMSSVLDDSERLFYEERVECDNPLFIYCALNLVVKRNLDDLKVPSKLASKKKIDGFVAFLCAHKETMMLMVDIDPDELNEYLDDIYN
ncbi:terminase large subunit [Listeria booriae]|uniref:terminase large subunit n=1 Tax=Listeria booriae TaxID=1552123 RepID=UPI00164E8760|nr:terminase TerL endonuclease subunit [Listeria booriae]MBC6300311.1 terminase large subunit [Listeria booriae]